MLVIRHVKGDNNLYVYTSNISGVDIGYESLQRDRTTKTDATLVFGCSKADDGAFENHAVGSVYWAKIWFADLGDAACRELASWTHETRTYEVAGFKRFYLSDNTSKRYVKYQPKHKVMVLCTVDDAQGFISSDGNTIWHTEDLYKIPVDGFDTVKLIPIDTYEYQQLKALGGKTPEEIIDAYTLTLLEGGVL